jgi:cell division protein FtsL
MRKDTVEALLMFIAVITPTAAFVVFWVGKLLNLRKEIIELQMTVGYQGKEIAEMKRDIEQLQDQWNRVRN